MVGNGVTEGEFDGDAALVPFAHGMGLISNDIYKDVVASCNGNYYNNVSDSCYKNLERVDQALDGLNIYNILEPCYYSLENNNTAKGNTSLPLSFMQLGVTEKPLPVRKRIFGRSWPFRAPVRDGLVPSWPELMSNNIHVPCFNDEVATLWLNNEAVRKAIHAAPESEAGPWSLCNDLYYIHDAGSMIPYHKNLTIKGYRALIYSPSKATSIKSPLPPQPKEGKGWGVGKFQYALSQCSIKGETRWKMSALINTWPCRKKTKWRP
ncbi:hypothetical protein L1049_021569 [Liquidambar formosana]|uniref:Uncharacterized protein n=1 Tax=Liquidambar formosana TaxID=63359 RepID=A0AAP0N1R1_LIQFO